MITYTCDRCKREIGESANLTIPDLDYENNDEKHYCRECKESFRVLYKVWLKGVGITNEVIQFLNVMADQKIDDHNSVWGGAGPDYPNKRLVTASSELKRRLDM